MINQLPSFFVLGVQKAGTTFLHEWLAQQPDTCLPQLKETHFFSHDARYQRGVDWYLNQFPKPTDNAIIGEIDPEYIFHKETPLRIRHLLKSPKFICVFRNPIDRAYSHYLMSIGNGKETLSFPEALRQEENRRVKGDKDYLPYHSYMARSKYSEQLIHYKDIFTDSDFLLVKFEDLFGSSTHDVAFANVYKFIGMRSEPLLPNLSKKSNPSSNPRSILLRNMIYGISPFKKAVGSLIPSKRWKLRLAVFLDRMNQAPLKNKSEGWRQQVSNEIWDLCNEEIVKLESLTGLKLQDWIRDK